MCSFPEYYKVIHLYIYMHFFFVKFLSHLGYYRILSRVPCAIQCVLVGYLFSIETCVYTALLNCCLYALLPTFICALIRVLHFFNFSLNALLKLGFWDFFFFLICRGELVFSWQNSDNFLKFLSFNVFIHYFKL